MSSLMSGFVFNLFWQTALMSVVGFAALKVAAKASAPTRSSLAAAGLAAVLALPLPNFFFLAADAGWFKKSVETVVQANPAPGAAWRFDLGALGGAPAAPAAPVQIILAPETGSSAMDVTAKLRGLLRRWAPLVGAVWAAGAVFMLARLLYGLALLRRFRRGLRLVSDRRFDAAMAAAAVFKPGLRTDIFLSPEIESPLTIGLFRPVMVLPEKLYSALKDDEIKSIVLHELSHIHHHDHLVGFAKRVVVAANWWNPLVHILSAEHSVAREEVSDNYALAELGPKAYAGCLVELATKTCLISGLPAAIGMADVHVGLEQRVRNILSSKRKLEMRTDKTVRNAVVAFFCGMAVMLGGAQYVLAQEDAGGRASLDALVMPGANVMIKFDLASAEGSAIGKRLKSAVGGMAHGVNLGKLEEKLKKFDNSGKSFTLYMTMGDLFFDSSNAAGAMKNLGVLFGVELKKPMDMKLVEEMAQAILDADKPTGDRRKLERRKYKGYKLLSVSAALPGAPNGAQTEFLLGMDTRGQLLFGGLAESVKSAIMRMESGKNVALSPEMQALSKTGPSGAQYQLVINVPEKMRQGLREAFAKEAAGMEAAGNPMGAGMALKQLDSLVVAATLGESLELDVNGNFAKPEAAQLLNGMLEPLLMAAKINLPKLADGKPATQLEDSLKSEAVPGSTVLKLSASLSPRDLEVFGKSPLLMQIPGLAPGAMPGSAPAAN